MARGFDGRAVLDADAVNKLVKDKLLSSGIKDGKPLNITAMLPADTAAEGLWLGAAYPAMRVPYKSPWGDVWGFYRARCLLSPLPILPPDKEGKPRRFPKYTQLKGSAPHAYFPPIIDWKALLSDSTKRLFITEGELKAAAATLRGFPCIGLGGVWNFMSSERDIDFLEELDKISWTDRKVYICYDSDSATNKDIIKAERVLSIRLIQRGAQPYRVAIPAVL